jgi:Response regulator containing CheY-like receiver, AAA-type ATPase, and DNA-binding domains
MDIKTVLIVDDEEAVLYVLRNSLLKFGHEFRILTAQDGKTALHYFEKFQIDLLITDYRMPGMNGLELIETIRNVQPNTHIILITAFGSEEIETKATRFNVFAYLKKPLDLLSFRQTVKNALGDLSNPTSGLAVQTSNTQQLISNWIERLHSESGATCVMVADTREKSSLCIGDSDRLRKEQLISFLSTSLAIAEKAGEFIDEDNKNNLWLYRRGSQEDLFASRLDADHLLVLLISSQTVNVNKEALSRQIDVTRTHLQKIFTESIDTEKEALFGQGFNQAVQSELDKLFDDLPSSLSPNDSAFPPTSNGNAAASSFTMSYEEALALGLILPTDDNPPQDTN